MKKLVSILCIICMLFASLPIFAESAETFSLSYDSETAEISVSGKSLQKTVICIVVKGSTPLSELSDSYAPVCFMPFSVVNGEYDGVIGMPSDAESGKYTAYISAADGNHLYDSFVFINTDAAGSVLEKIKETPLDFVKIIDENASTLGIDTEDTFWKNNKTDILKLLNVIKTTYSSPSQLYNDIYKAYALIYVNGKETDDVLSTFKKYEPQLGIDYSDFFEEDTRLSDKIIKTLCRLIAEENFTSTLKTLSLEEILYNLKVLAAVKEAEDAIILRKVIEEDFIDLFSDMISSDKNYQKISDKNIHKVYTKMILKDFSEFEDIEKAFKASTKAVATPADSSSGSSGSSSGSTGGGGSVATIPHVKEPENNTSEENTITTPSNPTDVSTPVVNSGNFSDVSESSWAYEAVSELLKKGVINGYNDGTFKPNNNVTRAEFAKIAYQAFSDKFAKVEKVKGRKTKVALLGDSLTQGTANADGTYTKDVAYSDYLSEILGNDYDIKNFGRSAHGILKEHKYPYLTTAEYSSSLEYNPDIIVSMFGTNDIKTDYWENAKATYSERYKYFINSYKEINPNVQVIVVLPPPFYVDDPLRPIENLKEGINIIKETAKEEGYILVDLYSEFTGGESYFPDKLHLSAEGAKKAATAISRALSDDVNVSFSDVDNQWFAPYVNMAASAGIIKGSDGKFNPDAFIKREDAAVIIYNIFKLSGITDVSAPTYIDKDSISTYAYTSVGALFKLKVMVGANDKFRPTATITRAESAQLIFNALNYLNSRN